MYDTERFRCERFLNTVILLIEEKKEITVADSQVILITKTKSNLSYLSSLLKDANIVFLYDFCSYKSQILPFLNKETIVIWRFFGYEYYSTKPKLIFSKSTIKALYETDSRPRIASKLLLYIKREYEKRLLRKNLKRIKMIDYILCVCFEEYEFLKNFWAVPSYLRMNLFGEISLEGYPDKKNNTIIFGNSRNPANNHLDVLDIFSSVNTANLKILMFFSYGRIGNYSRIVETQASKIAGITIVKDFLPKEEFTNIYREASILIINSYRQMALGNIVTGIKNGLKIYLNDKNVLKDWLLNNGLKIFSITDLKADLLNNNIKLSMEDMYHNIKQYNMLASSFTKSDFCSKIESLA